MKKPKRHRALDKARAASKSKSKMQEAGSAIAKALKPVAARLESNLDARITEQWKAGATIGQLASEYSKKRSQIRRSITVTVGGRDEFRKLRATGAGGTAVAFGGKRSSGRTREAIALDDSKVPVIQSKDIRLKTTPAVVNALDALRGDLGNRLDEENLSQSERMRMETTHANAQRVVAQSKTDAKWKGWRVENYQTAVGAYPRLIAPDGKLYVRATSTERADYIVQNRVGATRWKIESEARAAKVEAKQRAQIEQGTKALKATRSRKRDAKKARRTAK
jgi:hypothetical protein